MRIYFLINYRKIRGSERNFKYITILEINRKFISFHSLCAKGYTMMGFWKDSPKRDSPRVSPEIIALCDFKGEIKGEKKGYKKLKHLGAGAFGDVYKVKDISTKRMYALKEISNLSQQQGEDAQKETGVLQNIHHSSIVKHVGSFFQNHGGNRNYSLCIVMELIEGKDLGETLLKLRKKPQINWCMDVFMQILSGVYHLHGCDPAVIHRDLKPDNILVSTSKDGETTIKIVDFGLAVELSRASATLPTRGGTISYLAPEVLKSQRATGTVDIWALGLILYQMITLNTEFKKEIYGWQGYITRKPNALEEEVKDKSLRCLLKRMLDHDSTSRISAKALWNHEIIRGWKFILSAQSTDKLPSIKDLSTHYYLGAFVSLLDKKTPKTLLNLVFQFIDKFIENEEIRNIVIDNLLYLGLIPKLCKLIACKTTKTRTTRLHLINTNQNNNFLNDTSSNNKTQSSQNDPDDLAINLLLKFLDNPTYHIQVSNKICSENFLEIFLEKFKEINIGMKKIIIFLIQIPFVRNELEKNYALENILYSMMQEDDKVKEYIFDVWIYLKNTTNSYHFNGFLNEFFQDFLYQKQSFESALYASDTANELIKLHDSFIYKICCLIKSSKSPEKLINSSNENLWNQIIDNIFSSSHNSKYFLEFVFRLIHLILPIHKIVNFVLNKGLCTTSILGKIIVYQNTFNSICLSCKNTCLMFNSSNNNNNNLFIYHLHSYCQCFKKYNCKSASLDNVDDEDGFKNYNQIKQNDFISTRNQKIPFLTTNTNDDFILCEQAFHKTPYLYIKESKNRLKIKISENIKNSSEIFYITGIKKKLTTSNHTNDPQKTNTETLSNSIQFYSEIKIKKSPKNPNGQNSVIAFGISANPNLSLYIQNRNLLGKNDKEIAYYNDGKIYYGDCNLSFNYAPAYGFGDIVGCGITNDNKLFFTLNGLFLGFIDSNLFKYLRSGSYITSSIGIFGHSAHLIYTFSKNFIYSNFIHSNSSILPSSICQLNTLAVQLLFSNVNSKIITLFAKFKNTDVISILLHCIKCVDLNLLHNITKHIPNFHKISYCPPFFIDLFQNYEKLKNENFSHPNLHHSLSVPSFSTSIIKNLDCLPVNHSPSLHSCNSSTSPSSSTREFVDFDENETKEMKQHHETFKNITKQAENNEFVDKNLTKTINDEMLYTSQFGDKPDTFESSPVCDNQTEIDVFAEENLLQQKSDSYVNDDDLVTALPPPSPKVDEYENDNHINVKQPIIDNAGVYIDDNNVEISDGFELLPEYNRIRIKSNRVISVLLFNPDNCSNFKNITIITSISIDELKKSTDCDQPVSLFYFDGDTRKELNTIEDIAEWLKYYKNEDPILNFVTS